ncbi:MAG: ferrochelatase [Marmoricola sp.]
MTATDPRRTDPYGALLLVSFGGPEKPEDVVPFLRNVTRGRDIPEERLLEVGEHYFGFGGRSPINDQNRALLAAIREDLATAGVDLPVYWGNRNWDHYLTDAMEQLRADGVERAICFVTSAYSSYSGCRQYRENLAAARDEAAGTDDGRPRLDRLRVYFNHPGFVEPMVDNTLAALDALPDAARDRAHVLFVTHSIPIAMAQSSGPGEPAATGDDGAYARQHRSVAEAIMAAVQERTGRVHDHDLVYCSRSGPPQVPWLEPDVNDRMRELAADGVPGVVVVPIGFVSDHMEVAYDLDTEAAATAEELGLPFQRAATCGVDPRFVAMVRELVLERAAAERGEAPDRPVVGGLPPAWDRCRPDCCPNLRAPLPTVGGADDVPDA